MKLSITTAFFLLCATFGLDSAAVTTQGAPTRSPPATAPGRRSNASKPVQVSGRLEDLDLQHGHLRLKGMLYTFSPGSVKVVDSTAPGRPAALAVGQLVMLIATGPDTPHQVAQIWIVSK